MYCQECGCRIDDADAIFCPECGFRTGVERGEPRDSGAHSGIYASGFVFTDVTRLACKFRTDEPTIHGILNSFMSRKTAEGVYYRLINTGDAFAGEASDDVGDYMEILTAAYDQVEDKTSPLYLFIIGGDDIIPMPSIRHYVHDVSDKTIDTDILYSYPYGRNMLPRLEDLTIYQLEQAFFVGRLPIGEDTTIEDLCRYLNRDIEYSGGIPLIQAYGQCDPNWKNVSATVADDLVSNGMFRNLDGNLPSDHYFRRLILSPQVTVENVEQVFHTGASLYYFNLHGGNALESRGYFGAPLRKRQTYPVLLPEHLATSQSPNIIVSEACYGARFIGMDKGHSMLLSSIYTQSLVFLGSSRIAWGNVDAGISPVYIPTPPMLADTIALGFMRSLIQGYTAGQALYLARSMVFSQDSDGSPNTVATVAEFNLFGDPSLSTTLPEQAISAHSPVSKSAYVTDKSLYRYKVEEISTTDKSSILQLVRRAVDNNILRIQEQINHYLYEQYGIEARQAGSVVRMKYSNGNRELRFSYDVSFEGSVSMVYTVTTSENGKIKSVIMTR